MHWQADSASAKFNEFRRFCRECGHGQHTAVVGVSPNVTHVSCKALVHLAVDGTGAIMKLRQGISPLALTGATGVSGRGMGAGNRTATSAATSIRHVVDSAASTAVLGQII